eukprot:5172443-Amphidinium_carterae.1
MQLQTPFSSQAESSRAGNLHCDKSAIFTSGFQHRGAICAKSKTAVSGIEPRTSCTLSENHTTRPNSR